METDILSQLPTAVSVCRDIRLNKVEHDNSLAARCELCVGGLGC